MSDAIDDLQILDRAVAELEVGLWIGSLESGETRHMNGRFGALLQVSREDASRPDLRASGGDPLAAADLPFERARRTNAPLVLEDVGVRAADGTQNHLRVRALPLRDAKGEVTLIMVTALDVGAESSLMKNRLSLAVRHAPIAFWSVDAAGVVTMSEGAILSKFGVRPGELVGRSLFDVYREHPTIPQDIRRALAGESLRYTTEVGDVMLETWLAPIRAASGEPAGAIGVSTDITERVRMEGELIESDRGLALGTLAASIAHEINNPLTYTLLALEQLRAAVTRLAGASTDETRSACLTQVMTPLDVMQDGLRNIRVVTQDLRAFSRTDAEATAVDVPALARSALRLVAKELEGQVRVVVELEDVPPVLASEARLIQVFVNLLLNAAQALADNVGERVVTFSTRHVDDTAVVIVADNGPGVPHAMRERIFEPFITTKPVGLGTGLGLFVCRNIVRALGGEINVEDRPGGGAAFRVCLPAAPAEAGATAAQSTPPSVRAFEGRVGRILVVDDDVRVGAALQKALRQAGHSVTLVHSAPEAISLLVAEPRFDLCFCDLMMHGVASTDVFTTVAARTPGRERDLVYMTGGAFTADARSFVAERGDGVVEKPFDVVREAARRLEKRSP